MTPARLWRSHVRIAAKSAAQAARRLAARLGLAGYILAPLLVLGVLGLLVNWASSWQPETRLTLAGWAVISAVLVGVLTRSQEGAPEWADELDGHSPHHWTGGAR